MRFGEKLLILADAQGDSALLSLAGANLLLCDRPTKDQENLREALQVAAVPHWKVTIRQAREALAEFKRAGIVWGIASAGELLAEARRGQPCESWDEVEGRSPHNVHCRDPRHNGLCRGLYRALRTLLAAFAQLCPAEGQLPRRRRGPCARVFRGRRHAPAREVGRRSKKGAVFRTRKALPVVALALIPDVLSPLARTLRRGAPTNALRRGLPVNQEPIEGLTPKTVFDVRLALELVGRATQRLEREQAAKGKAQTFSIVRPFLGAESTQVNLSYEQAARALNLDLPALKRLIRRLRQRFAQLLSEEVAQTVLGPNDVDAACADHASSLGKIMIKAFAFQ